MSGQNAGNALAQALQGRWRRLRYMLERLGGSLAQRGLRGTLRRIAMEWRRRPERDAALDLLPLDAPFVPFALPVSDTPQVSVVIPVHGQLSHTLACLRSIARHGATAAFEVIVVDDASTDGSADALDRIDGLRLLRNPINLGFVGTCNAGAAAARGEVLLFLNNDTQVTPGWLDTLLETLRSVPRAGVVGSRLVYPDGRLQEAGASVFADGTAWSCGRFEARDDPRYMFRRDVDYVSGAALMIPRALFESVGGFDARYAPAYYEDTDLAFAVRAAGRRVLYEPRSLVVHFEGVSAGLDPHAGMKRHQLEHRRVFAEKWAETLKTQPAPGTPEADDPPLRGVTGRILVIDATTPEPARDSGSLRLTAICELLDRMGWQTTLAPVDGHADAAQVERLGTRGVQVLRRPFTRDPLTWLRRHGARLDAVMLCRHPVAAQFLPAVRKHAPGARVMFDTVDLHGLRERRAAEVAGNPTLARRADASERRELALVDACDVTLVVSAHERDLLAAARPLAQVELLSNIHRVYGCRADYAARRDLVFVGGFGHPPNVDAVDWLTQQILPILWRTHPDICLHLIGDVPDHARQRLAGPRVKVHGRVAELAPFMDGCRVALAPLRFGAGVKGKVNMAMSFGLPVVATPIAAEGMHLVDGRDVVLAGDADAFAAAIARVYDDPVLWQRMSDGGLANVAEHFSFAAAETALRRALKRPDA